MPLDLELDPLTLDSLKRRAKRQLRQRMRTLRSALPVAAQMNRSAAIVDRLLRLPELESARGVALFWPMEGKGEVDLRALDRRYRERGTALFYPFMGDPDGQGLRRVDAVSELVDAGHGFLEPSPDRPVALPGDIDVIVVPALAVSADGGRLGYGSGFYDALLPRVRPPAIAVVVAFDFQLLAELPVTAGDVACDVIVTDTRTLSSGTLSATDT